MGNGLRNLALALIGIVGYVAISIWLEQKFDVPWATSSRVACAIACLALIAKMAREEPDSAALKIGLALSAIWNVVFFLTPLTDREPSRGEILLFGVPDAVFLFAAFAFTYRAVDEHQRAIRQQIFLGLFLFVAIAAVLIGPAFLFPGHRWP